MTSFDFYSTFLHGLVSMFLLINAFMVLAVAHLVSLVSSVGQVHFKMQYKVICNVTILLLVRSNTFLIVLFFSYFKQEQVDKR